MKTPNVTETRRAGQTSQAAHQRQVSLVARSLLAVPPRTDRWDERTRTDRNAA
jgi:hypothetical protein